MRREESGVGSGNAKSIKSYRDLVVWQKAHEFAKMVLELTEKQFPDNDGAKIVKRQLIRSALSVPANIAEGYGGHRGSAYRNYLVIARRSLTESDYWLFLCSDMGYTRQLTYSEVVSSVSEIRAMLSAIIGKLDGAVREGSAEYVVTTDS